MANIERKKIALLTGLTGQVSFLIFISNYQSFDNLNVVKNIEKFHHLLK